MGWWWGAGNMRVVLKLIFEGRGVGMHQAKLWASQIFELTKMKGNLQLTPLFNTIKLTAIPRLAKPPFGHQITCTDRHCASEKQPAKSDHSSVEYEIY